MNPLLMIEDDVRLSQMVADYLTQTGYTVEQASSAHHGLERLQAAPTPALVILDLMLPDLDGLELCRRIRQLPGEEAHTPVLMLTAKGDPMDRVLGLDIGADDYLTKPLSHANCWPVSARFSDVRRLHAVASRHPARP